MSELPQAFLDRVRIDFGKGAESLITALDSEVTTSVHLNSGKKSDRWKDAQNVPWYVHGRLLAERPSFTLDPLFHAGCYYPQESSSMIVAWILKELFGENRNLTCLDVCAAPGGKSLLIADFLGQEGRLVSNEIVKNRNAILREVIIKWGLGNSIVTQNDTSSFAEIADYFDVVLVDAPCSGEGMFRKDHVARDEWSMQNVAMCSIRQRDILENVIPSVKEGGYLIYSTCTFAHAENEENCKWLLQSGQFECVQLRVPSEWRVNQVQENGAFALRFLPGLTPGEGFFISVFKKKTKDLRQKVTPKPVFASLTKKEEAGAGQWVSDSTNLFKNNFGDVFQSPFSMDELNMLAGKLYITLPGLEIGRLVREELNPAHSLALYSSEIIRFGSIELTEEEAIAYLKGEQFGVEGERGWQVVTFQNHSLGWIKNLGNRFNNYYPKEWRIRMK